MGERGRVSRRTSKELGSQPVGYPCRLGTGGDGAAAHRPQAGVLTEMERWKNRQVRDLGRGSRSAAGGENKPPKSHSW